MWGWIASFFLTLLQEWLCTCYVSSCSRHPHFGEKASAKTGGNTSVSDCAYTDHLCVASGAFVFTLLKMSQETDTTFKNILVFREWSTFKSTKWRTTNTLVACVHGLYKYTRDTLFSWTHTSTISERTDGTADIWTCRSRRNARGSFPLHIPAEESVSSRSGMQPARVCPAITPKCLWCHQSTDQ